MKTYQLVLAVALGIALGIITTPLDIPLSLIFLLALFLTYWGWWRKPSRNHNHNQ